MLKELLGKHLQVTMYFLYGCNSIIKVQVNLGLSINFRLYIYFVLVEPRSRITFVLYVHAIIGVILLFIGCFNIYKKLHLEPVIMSFRCH